MKKKKSLFSTLAICFLAVVFIAFMASAMTVNTLSQMQPILMVGGQDMAIQAQPFVKTAVLNSEMVQTDQGLADLTQLRAQYAFSSIAAADVPKNNLIYVSVTIRDKGALAGMDTFNAIYKTVMVKNQGGIGGIAPQLAATQKLTI
jgi:hypothetical protein